MTVPRLTPLCAFKPCQRKAAAAYTDNIGRLVDYCDEHGELMVGIHGLEPVRFHDDLPPYGESERS